MNNPTKLTAALAVVVIGGVVLYTRIHSTIIVKRFPEIEPSIVRKAHRIMLKKAALGEYGTEEMTDEQWDAIFLAEVDSFIFPK